MIRRCSDQVEQASALVHEANVLLFLQENQSFYDDFRVNQHDILINAIYLYIVKHHQSYNGFCQRIVHDSGHYLPRLLSRGLEKHLYVDLYFHQHLELSKSHRHPLLPQHPATTQDTQVVGTICTKETHSATKGWWIKDFASQSWICLIPTSSLQTENTGFRIMQMLLQSQGKYCLISNLNSVRFKDHSRLRQEGHTSDDMSRENVKSALFFACEPKAIITHIRYQNLYPNYKLFYFKNLHNFQKHLLQFIVCDITLLSNYCDFSGIVFVKGVIILLAFYKIIRISQVQLKFNLNCGYM